MRLTRTNITMRQPHFMTSKRKNTTIDVIQF